MKSTKKAALSSERRRLLSIFEEQIHLEFNDKDLLDLAFCHRSFANEGNRGSFNNERLEFLGDSILGMIICHYLFTHFTMKNEGELAKLKSFLVSEDSLAESAKRLNIADYLLMGKGEERSGGRHKKAILADCMEALFAAVFIDRGYQAAENFILSNLMPQIELAKEDRHEQDHKTLFQEKCQKIYKQVPVYKILKESGPDHDKTYIVEVFINDEVVAQGAGRNKKEAERVAAKIAYIKLFKETDHG